MKNVLFVCSANICRSVAAELMFRAFHPDIWVRSCGTEPSAIVPMNKHLLLWSDMIICMEDEHAKAVLSYFSEYIQEHDGVPPIMTLGIRDIYMPNDPELVMLLRARVPQFLTMLLKPNPGVYCLSCNRYQEKCNGC